MNIITKYVKSIAHPNFQFQIERQSAQKYYNDRLSLNQFLHKAKWRMVKKMKTLTFKLYHLKEILETGKIVL